MNHNYYCVFDFETGSLNPDKCQITQIGAIIIHPRSLKVVDVFNKECCPELDDDKAVAKGLDPVETNALCFTRKIREDLLKCPSEKVVWERFAQFIKKYTPSVGGYKSPIPCGFNIINFDLRIHNRLCSMYGPKGGLFNDVNKIDFMDHMFFWTENNPDVESLKLGAAMDWMGMPSHLKENAHDALQDVKNTANCLLKMLHFVRDITKQTDFNRAFSNSKLFVE